MISFKVQSTVRDPVPVFVDKLLGPSGVAVGVHVGLIRVVKAKSEASTDIIPADVVVNSTLALAWKTSLKHFKEDEVQIYNCAINSIKPVQFGQYS